MIWVGVVLSELFFGFQLSNFLLSKKLSCYEIMPISIPIGFGISSILFFFCSLNLSFSSFHLILHSCGLTLVGTMIHIKKNKFIVKFSKPFKRDLIFNIVSKPQGNLSPGRAPVRVFTGRPFRLPRWIRRFAAARRGGLPQTNL